MTFTTATVPNPDIPLVNPQTGCINPDWWLWIVAIFNRTGGAGSPVDINSLQLDSAYPFAQMVASRYPLPQQQQTPFETSLSLVPGAKTEIAQLKNRIHNLETLLQVAQRNTSSISYTTIDGTPIGQAVPSTGSFSSLTTGSLNVTTPLPVASGGTGSSTAAGARSNLGLGSMATQNANAVAITGGTAALTGASSVTTSGLNNSLAVSDNGGSGAHVLLSNTGATNPNKYLRSRAGNLELINSGYTSIIMTVSDVGALSVSGLLTGGSSTLVASSVALANGAAASTATLTNAPTAGNPTKWVPINDNGTTRYIPAW